MEYSVAQSDFCEHTSIFPYVNVHQPQKGTIIVCVIELSHSHRPHNPPGCPEMSGRPGCPYATNTQCGKMAIMG